jgi:hypothetical protein
MGEAASRAYVDHETYLRLEREADARHEWLDGHVHAMARGTLDHGQLAAGILGEPTAVRTGTAPI